MGIGLTLSDVLVLPLILLVIGSLTYVEAFVRGKDKERLPNYRWAGTLLIAFAALRGLVWVWNIMNPSFDGAVYRASLIGKKIVVAHYLSFLLPAFGLVGIFLLEKWFKKYQSAAE